MFNPYNTSKKQTNTQKIKQINFCQSCGAIEKIRRLWGFKHASTVEEAIEMCLKEKGRTRKLASINMEKYCNKRRIR
jgi:hypothetical protein